MSNPFFYDAANDPNYNNTTNYPSPTQNQYKCSFSGSGTLAPYSIEGSKLCVYEPIVNWSGGKTKCSWKKKKKGWITWKTLSCDWKTLTITYKDEWCCCWKSPDIVVMPTTTIDMTVDTNININQSDASYILTSTPPTSAVNLTNHTISVCDYANIHDITAENGTTYYNLPCMTINIKTNGESVAPIYSPQKTFTVDASGNFPTKISIIPSNETETKSNGFTYKTNMTMDMYIDTNNTSSWIYFRVKITLDIYDSYGTKIDTTSTDFNLNLKSMSPVV
jgi:hypothetical protein